MQLIYVVQFILMCGLLGSIFFILDIMFKKDKYEILYFLILPPYILYFIWKNFDECKNAFYLSLIFLIVLTYAGLIGNRPFAKEALEVMFNIFFWHIYLVELLFS